MATKSTSAIKTVAPSDKSPKPRSVALVGRPGGFRNINDVIEFTGALAADVVTGSLTASVTAAANGSIRLLLRSHELAIKHGKPAPGSAIAKFMA